MSLKKLLNKTCQIKQITYTQNAASGEQQTVSTTLETALPCRLRTRTVSERKYSLPAYALATHSIYIAAKSTLYGKKLSVLIDGNTYDVLGLINMGGEDRLFCLYAERRA